MWKLIRKKGDTDNDFLYTGEQYNANTGLYYLRARYMNPSTGTFISMDSYQGSIYDPDTLHKYLYANGNPVMNTDPSGFSSCSLGDFVATIQCIAYLNFPVLNAMGMISATANAAATSMLGGTVEDTFWSWVEGYITGFGFGMVLCMALACSVVTFAITLGVISSISGALSSVMLIRAITQKNEKGVIVYGALVLLSIIGCAKAHNIMMSVSVTGDNGIASFVSNKGEIEDVIVRDVESDSGAVIDNITTQPDFIVTPEGVAMSTN
ncbi:MAG: RHS repeat-associated core domain-containing protein [Lachnospiraceae bacterium]